MMILIVLLVLFLVFGGGYWGHTAYGPTQPYAGPGFGIGALVICLLVLWALGILRF